MADIDLSKLAESVYGKNVVIALGEFLASKLKPEIRVSTAETEAQSFYGVHDHGTSISVKITNK